MQDLNNKITGNSLTAAEWNEVPSEIQNVIEGLGITLSGGDLNQLGKAIAGYAANGSFYTDSGAADAYVLSVVGSKQALPEYTDGMEIVWLADNANTGASTVNVAGLGIKDIKTLGGNVPAAGDVSITAINYALYDSANGWFVLQDSPNSLITAITITPPTDADVTLTNAQATRDRLVLADGAWTLSRNIIVPDESRRFYVDNTAGSFNATVKTATGSGVTVPTGQSAILVCDSVDVLDPLPSASLPLLHVQDQKTSGTGGGASVVGTQTRDLNTVITNEISGASLAGDQVTLAAGTYYIVASSPAYNGPTHKAFLYNVTDASDVIIGTSEDCTSGSTSRSIVTGRFTLAGTKVLELRQYTSAIFAAGLGNATSTGQIEVYSDFQIRVAS